MKPMQRQLSCILCLGAVGLTVSAALGLQEDPAQGESQGLAATTFLSWSETDLSGRLMDGAHRFVERQIDESIEKRRPFWRHDFSSLDAYERSIKANRTRFGQIIGVVDPRVPVTMERFGTEDSPALVSETPTYLVFQVRWPVLEGLAAEGLLVRPKRSPVARVVTIPDADQTPEQLLGLADGLSTELQLARRLAENDFEVVIPALVNRQRIETDDPRLRRSDQTHREWIYRQAFHMGRHVIGYEVQIALSAVDWFEQLGGTRIGVSGYGEGGLIALYAAALDTRIDAALVSGYFDSRQKVWSEPIYRNVWGLLREFGDAEIASLIAPRSLIIEYSPVPEVTGQKGALEKPPLERVQAEIARTVHGGAVKPPELVIGKAAQPVGPGSIEAVKLFAMKLGVDSPMAVSSTQPVDRRQSFSANNREARLMKQMEGCVQGLVRKSEHVRDQFFLFSAMPQLIQARWSTERRHPIHSSKDFVEAARRFREIFLTEAMGQFDEPMLPLNPRTRRILETNKWVAYDVVLDVWPEVFAWGVLVVPKNIRPGERRPVVVCQHGRDGVPRDTIDADKSSYNNFAGVLADRGFVTFAPHNLYRGEDRYRWLDRKANSVKGTLFSFIIAQHGQILRWLETLPFVDESRIAFYGLSYGGETAVRVPSILEEYCLSICSGDFNQWTRKVASTDQPFSFMRTIEWEMPYWNLGNTFDYAEMAYLMVPRPFMVERGHLDLVGRDRWVAHEYAKVRWLYAQLGLSDRTEIEFFQGGHSINGEKTFEFLHKHLGWPEPEDLKAQGQ
jgi:dienelactone hydrolase